MAAIKVENYQNIAQFYANAQIQVSGVVSYYYDAAYEVVLLQTFDPEIDLLSAFYNAYLAANVVYNRAPQTTIQAVAILHSHILNRARASDGTTKFANMDEWLDATNTFGVSGTNFGRKDDVDTSITVPSEFASLSAQAGYSIDSTLQS
jgi:hypothetical protein